MIKLNSSGLDSLLNDPEVILYFQVFYELFYIPLLIKISHTAVIMTSSLYRFGNWGPKRLSKLLRTMELTHDLESVCLNEVLRCLIPSNAASRILIYSGLASILKNFIPSQPSALLLGEWPCFSSPLCKGTVVTVSGLCACKGLKTKESRLFAWIESAQMSASTS